MDQCEFLMHFSYNVVGFHTTSQCSKNEENRKNEKNMRVVATCKTKTKNKKKMASCSYLWRYYHTDIIKVKL